MFVMFFNVVFSMFVCYSAAFCQLCFYNKDWIGLAERGAESRWVLAGVLYILQQLLCDALFREYSVMLRVATQLSG